MKRWSLRLVRDALLIYVGLVALVALGQRRYIYFPQREEHARLENMARGAGAEIWAASDDGDYLGWKVPCETGGVDILVFHGNAGYALHRLYFVECLKGLHFARVRNVYLFEYPGYGARLGMPSEKNIKRDAERAVARLVEESADGRVILLGESLGGGVACYIAARYPDKIPAIFLATPFSSLVDAARVHYPYLPVRWFLRERYDNVGELANYRGRVFILAAEHDGVVPAVLARKLYDSYAGPKRIWVEPDADHNNLVYTPTAEWWIAAWQWLLADLQDAQASN